MSAIHQLHYDSSSSILPSSLPCNGAAGSNDKVKKASSSSSCVRRQGGHMRCARPTTVVSAATNGGGHGSKTKPTNIKDARRHRISRSSSSSSSSSSSDDTSSVSSSSASSSDDDEPAVKSQPTPTKAKAKATKSGSASSSTTTGGNTPKNGVVKAKKPKKKVIPGELEHTDHGIVRYGDDGVRSLADKEIPMKARPIATWTLEVSSQYCQKKRGRHPLATRSVTLLFAVDTDEGHSLWVKADTLNCAMASDAPNSYARLVEHLLKVAPWTCRKLRLELPLQSKNGNSNGNGSTSNQRSLCPQLPWYIKWSRSAMRFLLSDRRNMDPLRIAAINKLTAILPLDASLPDHMDLPTGWLPYNDDQQSADRLLTLVAASAKTITKQAAAAAASSKISVKSSIRRTNSKGVKVEKKSTTELVGASSVSTIPTTKTTTTTTAMDDTSESVSLALSQPVSLTAKPSLSNVVDGAPCTGTIMHDAMGITELDLSPIDETPDVDVDGEPSTGMVMTLSLPSPSPPPPSSSVTEVSPSVPMVPSPIMIPSSSLLSVPVAAPVVTCVPSPITSLHESLPFLPPVITIPNRTPRRVVASPRGSGGGTNHTHSPLPVVTHGVLSLSPMSMTRTSSMNRMAMAPTYGTMLPSLSVSPRSSSSSSLSSSLMPPPFSSSPNPLASSSFHHPYHSSISLEPSYVDNDHIDDLPIDINYPAPLLGMGMGMNDTSMESSLSSLSSIMVDYDPTSFKFTL